MKQYINEHKRWQKLAGIINEYKINNPGDSISKEDFMDFFSNMMDSMTDENDVKANWVSMSDPDVYAKLELPLDEFDLRAAYQISPEYHSYNEVLEIIESYEDEDILNKFKIKFS